MVKSKTNSESAVLSAVKANTEAINSVVQTLQMFTGAQVAPMNQLSPVTQVATVAPQPAPAQTAPMKIQTVDDMKAKLRAAGVMEHEFEYGVNGGLRISRSAWSRVKDSCKITNEQSIVRVE